MGEPISALTRLEPPLRPTDLIEVSRRIDGKWYGYKTSALSAYVGQATTTALGIVELATNEETILGEDGERAVTPQGLEAAIRDVLQNRIIQGGGILLNYADGQLTISADA